MHSYIEDFLRGRINESFFESNEQYKIMAKQIIEKGLKGKNLKRYMVWRKPCIIQINMLELQI